VSMNPNLKRCCEDDRALLSIRTDAARARSIIQETRQEQRPARMVGLSSLGSINGTSSQGQDVPAKAFLRLSQLMEGER
jgi:hypothetical protein